MRISLDYDRTYTADPEFWREFMRLAKTRGHEVVCVTCRYNNTSEAIVDMDCSIIYTDRGPKQDVAERSGVKIDVWVDDSPWSICHGRGHV